MKFHMFSDDVVKILNHCRGRKFVSNLTAAQKRGLGEIRELINSKTIRLSFSDKERVCSYSSPVKF